MSVNWFVVLQVSRKLHELLASERRCRSEDASSNSDSHGSQDSPSSQSRGKREREASGCDKITNGVSHARKSFEFPFAEGRLSNRALLVKCVDA